MKLLGDYHTHTIYSHGKSTVRENVEEAIYKGLKTIAIAEHGPGHVFYGVSWTNLKKIKNEIIDLREEFGDQIEILFGLEANIMDFEGNLDIRPDQVKEFDFVAAGFHNGIIPRDLSGKIFYSPIKYLKNFSKSLDNKIVKLATDAMIKASHKYDLKFLTHPGAKFFVDAKRLVAEMDQNTLLEINNKHGYLNLDQLKELSELGDFKVNFILNSDAHRKSDVGNVKNGIERIIGSGINLGKVINIEQ